MTEEEIYERLNEVFQDIFDDDTIEVDEFTTADDIYIFSEQDLFTLQR